MSKLFLIMGLVSSFSFAGNGAGGGTDSHREYRAWFLGKNRSIESCIKVSPLFGVSPAFIETEIKRAFSTWENYISSKRLEEKYAEASGMLGKPLPMMSTKIHLRGSCEGFEDLVFYFGVEDAVVKTAKAHYINPYGLAEQLTTDPKTGWSKGIIWVALPFTQTTKAPNWTLPNTLYAILLHEIGHTLGNEHVFGTIMDSSLGGYIASQTAEGMANHVLTRIDWTRELVICSSCGGNFVGDDLFVHPQIAGKDFQLLIGKAPVGKVTKHFSIKNGKMPHGELTLQDDMGSYSFYVSTMTTVNRAFDDASIFRIWYKDRGIGSARESYSLYGSISGMGKKRAIVLNRNAGAKLNVVDVETGMELFNVFWN